jgi:hypothetical protein
MSYYDTSDDEDNPRGQSLHSQFVNGTRRYLHHKVKAFVSGVLPMKTYRVNMIETVLYTVEVKASHREDAELVARERWEESLTPTADFDGIGEGVEIDSIEEML